MTEATPSFLNQAQVFSILRPKIPFSVPKRFSYNPFFSPLQSSAAWEWSVPLFPFPHVPFILQFTEIQHWCPPLYWTDLVKGIATFWLLSAWVLSSVPFTWVLCAIWHYWLFLPSHNSSLGFGDITTFGFSPASLSVSGLFSNSFSCAFSLNNEILRIPASTHPTVLFLPFSSHPGAILSISYCFHCR